MIYLPTVLEFAEYSVHHPVYGRCRHTRTRTFSFSQQIVNNRLYDRTLHIRRICHHDIRLATARDEEYRFIVEHGEADAALVAYNLYAVFICRLMTYEAP